MTSLPQSRGYIGDNVLGLYWGYSKDILGEYWGYIRVILGFYRGYMGVYVRVGGLDWMGFMLAVWWGSKNTLGWTLGFKAPIPAVPQQPLLAQ